jgi:RHS repeat-associated protein
MLKNHDRYGNLLKEQSTAGSVGTTCLAVSASTNQVTGTCALPSLSTYSYDANGNMLGDGVNSSMTYDAANHLISLYNSSSGGAAYVYDGNGNRVKKCIPNCTSPTSATVYIFSGSKVIAEYPAGSTGTSFSAEYLYAGGLKVATVTSSAQTYHLRDHLSVRVNTNSSGALIGEQGHYPFGENWFLTSTTTKEQFTTYERDAESGNDFAMARYNVNRLGRFSSVDPLSGNIGNPQSLNHYAYVTNDPINLADPTGMSDAIAICGAGPAKGYADQTCGGENGAVNGGGGSGGVINFGCIFSCFGSDGGLGQNSSGFGDSISGYSPPDPFIIAGCQHPGILFDPIPGSGICSGAWSVNGIPPMSIVINVTAAPYCDLQCQATAGYLAQQQAARAQLHRTMTSDDYIQTLPAAAAQATHALSCVGVPAAIGGGGTGAYQLGQPVPGSKPFVTPGSSLGTSAASDALRGLGLRSPVPIPTPVGGPGTGVPLRMASTTSVGGAVARYLPFVGIAAVAYSVYKLNSCLDSNP